MDIFIILALGLCVGWRIREEYSQAVIQWHRKEVERLREEKGEMRASLRQAEGRLLRLTPLIYPFAIDLRKIKIVTVVYATDENRLKWKVHEFAAFDFISDFRRERSRRLGTGELKFADQDTYALAYLMNSCGFYEDSTGPNYYYMTPLINLMNHDIAKDYYDWNEKEIMKR